MYHLEVEDHLLAREVQKYPPDSKVPRPRVHTDAAIEGSENSSEPTECGHQLLATLPASGLNLTSISVREEEGSTVVLSSYFVIDSSK